MLRHELYDIRRVIDRTLVFVVLSAGAASVYGVTVLLAHAVIGQAEEERRRIRRDLHDGLGPQLAGLALQLGMARKLGGRDPVASSQLLHRL
ncbi:MAG TPA: histidine kinase, partial [Acidimicrobiales bacterium]|nr:histidine kinase [Acidimicrobiales bacterium]